MKSLILLSNKAAFHRVGLKWLPDISNEGGKSQVLWPCLYCDFSRNIADSTRLPSIMIYSLFLQRYLAKYALSWGINHGHVIARKMYKHV